MINKNHNLTPLEKSKNKIAALPPRSPTKKNTLISQNEYL